MPEVESSGISHIGPAREDNQDSIRLPDDDKAAERGRLFAVADGMGGYAHGRLASTLALEKLFEVFYGGQALPARRALHCGFESANLEVFKEAQRRAAGCMGTTLTAATLVGNRLLLAHVGDSRAYLIRDRRAICLTDDHTTVGDLVRLKVLTPDKVRAHAQRSILTGGVGLSLFVKPDITEHPLEEGDRVILCSDGVWSVIQDHEFARLASTGGEARAVSSSLVELALERETDDNVSAIVILVRRLSSSPAEKENRRKGRSLAILDWVSRRRTPLLCSPVKPGLV